MADYITKDQYCALNGLAQPLPALLDAQITAFIPITTDLINKWCDRDFRYGLYEQQLRSENNVFLPLRNRPVWNVELTGTLNGTTTVSGLSSTSNLTVGMPVVGTNPVANLGTPAITPGTTIATITNSTSIVLSQAANVSGSQTLFFGLQVYLDRQTYSSGQAPDAYNANAALTQGVDFNLDVNDANNTICSDGGLIHGLNSGMWPAPFGYGWALLSPTTGTFASNVKAVYFGGYKTLPLDIELAACFLVNRLRQTSGMGPYISETVRDYSYRLPDYTGGLGGLFTPEVTVLLAQYRNIPW